MIMDLKVERHSIEVLHVKVPNEINGEQFSRFIQNVLGQNSDLHIKDGFSISVDDINNALDVGCHPEIDPLTKVFLQTVRSYCEGTAFTPNEFFFHRWEQ